MKPYILIPLFAAIVLVSSSTASAQLVVTKKSNRTTLQRTQHTFEHKKQVVRTKKRVVTAKKRKTIKHKRRRLHRRGYRPRYIYGRCH